MIILILTNILYFNYIFTFVDTYIRVTITSYNVNLINTINLNVIIKIQKSNRY